jgi:hypothetical protein
VKKDLFVKVDENRNEIGGIRDDVRKMMGLHNPEKD